MGLGVGNQYGCRVRAENEVGYCLIVISMKWIVYHSVICSFVCHSMVGACGASGQDHTSHQLVSAVLNFPPLSLVKSG